jgi:hypothetical protein
MFIAVHTHAFFKKGREKDHTEGTRESSQHF